MKYWNVINNDNTNRSSLMFVFSESENDALKKAKKNYGEDSKVLEITRKSLKDYFNSYEYNFYKAKELFHITDEKMIKDLYYGNISIGLLKHMIAEMEKIKC